MLLNSASVSDTQSSSEMRTLVLLFVVGLCVLDAASSLKICAFNVQSFGESKANNKKIMILSRCDVSLIQEVRDAKGAAVQALVKALNRFDKSNTYSSVESERLGRKSYKEQYVYVYRNNLLKVKDHYQYPKLEGAGANDSDVFSREPFIVRFHSPTTLVKDFVLIGQHTSPKTAMKEIDELYTVFRGVCKKWKTDNVMILGDLNAGCSYVSARGWRAVRLRSDPHFHWLIGDEQDTTVRERTRCSYDRIIAHGRHLVSGLVAGSARPFNFKEEFRLSEEEVTARTRFMVGFGPMDVNLCAFVWCILGPGGERSFPCRGGPEAQPPLPPPPRAVGAQHKPAASCVQS
ncbi:deoxyribonuclease I-like 1-like isoform X2 [Betta splendens]|uniref:Deoxyribonuclease I-like 1-like isoform X2 n=1 Tax=Betta splendens TaxID=158456 RepID=A0A9W2XWL6_BETSP|nr:deoxyribonuclease I-like 1-like isoform X2 [Betta splendens]